MAIEAECPLCGHKGSVPEKFDGKQVKCPECCNLFIVAGPAVPAAAGAKSSGSQSGERKISMPAGNGQGQKSPTSGSNSGQHKIAKAGPSAQGVQKPKAAALTHQGTMKNPTAGSGSGQQKIAATGNSGQGTQKKPAVAGGSGTFKGPSSGSASGTQKVGGKPPSGQGTQKKPAAKAGARNGVAGDPFSNLTYDEPTPAKGNYRRRRRSKAMANFLALIFLLGSMLVFGGIAIGLFYHFNTGGTMDQLVSFFKSPAKPEETPTEPEKKDPEPPIIETKEPEKTPDLIAADKGPAILSEPKTNIVAHVRVEAAAVAEPTGKQIKTKDKKFMVRLKIENKGKERILYTGYGTLDAINEEHPPKLSDATKANIPRMTFDVGVVADGGVLTAETVDPGKTITDVIVFELPMAGSPFVKLELSTANITGVPGKYIFLIPAKMITGTFPKADPKPDPKGEPKPDPKPEPEKEPAMVAQQRLNLKGKVVAGRLDAIMILAEFGPNAATAVPDLVPILKSDPSETLRTAAANCLGAIGPKAAKESKDAVPVLIDKVRNDDFPRVKIESAKALALIGAKEALPALMGVLKTEKEDTVITAVKDAIKKLDPDAKLD